MKTILSGVKTWTRGEIRKSTADWGQNDPNADNYVKNRTHWEEDVEISVIPKQQTVAFYPYVPFNGGIGFDPEEGVTYIVTFNGTRYELTAWHVEEYDWNYIGNRLYLDGVDDGSDIPFVFDGYVMNAPYGVYTISISTLVDGIETEVVEEQTLYSVWTWGFDNYPLEPGNVYSVNFDGNTYEFTATEDPDTSIVIIGDITQYPFVILYADEYLALNSTIDGIHNISLTNVTSGAQILTEECIGHCPFYDNINNFNLQADQTYTVVWDDEVYSCIAKNIGEDVVCIGNLIYAYVDGWDAPARNTNEPFLIVTDKFNNFSGIYLDSEESHTVSVFTTKTVVHKLDSKYLNLPENLATMDDVEEVRNYANSVYDTANKKMDRKNPSGTGTFSMNRKPQSVIGNYSHAEGYNTTAANPCSHAEGSSTIARGDSAHSEGGITSASGPYTHAEGYSTKAAGSYSHTEGYYTEATGLSQHVQGEWNIPDQETLAVARTLHAHIVGNGTGTDARSNAHTLDWDGNAWFAGDVYVGSTSGVNKDSGSKKLIATPSNAVAGDLLTYDGTNWVRISRADLIAEIIAALPRAEEATF